MKRRSLLFVVVALVAAMLPTTTALAGGGYESGGISGIITDADGNPIEYIGVKGYKLNEHGEWYQAYFAYTNAAGRYEMSVWGTPVSVRLYMYQKHVSEEDATWRSEWYHNADSIEGATAVYVPAGAWVTANEVMTGPGTLAGRVTAAATGDPIAGIEVKVRLAAAGAPGVAPRCDDQTVKTGADGRYEITPLRADEWVVEFRDPEKRWSDQWSGGGMIEDRAAHVTIDDGATTTLNAQLVPGGAVQIYPIVVESGVKPKEDRPESGEFCVDAFRANGTHVAGRRDAWDFRFVLPAGDYLFRFSDCEAPVQFATAWYPNATTMADAEPITVENGVWNGTFTIFTAHRCDGEWPTIIGTTGDDEILGRPRRDVIVTGKGNDEVLARGGHDLVCLGEGDDQGVGGLGRDVIFGGGGIDLLRGGEGADALHGGGGRDQLRGDAGGDRLFGNGGSDLLTGGAGDDVLDGGSGRDTVSYPSATGPVNVNLAAKWVTGEGKDRLFRIANAIGSRHDDRLVGDGGGNRLVGGHGDDELFGGAGDDNLLGAAGSDKMAGGAGNDQVRGFGGADTLHGGTGEDLLSGGSGSDVCHGGETLVSC